MSIDYRGLLLDMFQAAVNAAAPALCVPAHLPRRPKGRTIVVGAGKAAASMAAVPVGNLIRLALDRESGDAVMYEGSFQAYWLDGCRSISVAGSARGRDLDIAAANKRFAADCS
jgi:hypothetical protein